PSRPPLALTSSRQISIPSNEGLPPPARPPVCGMLMPILIGPPCACSRLLPNGEAASAAPALAVASRRRREIVPDFFDIGCLLPLVLLFGLIACGFAGGVPRQIVLRAVRITCGVRGISVIIVPKGASASLTALLT